MFIRKFATWYGCTERGEKEEALEQEWRMLASLLFLRPPNVRNHDWKNLRSQLRIIRVLRHALRVAADNPGKGRPPSDLRRFALQALDLKRTGTEKWTWAALAEQFGLYRCGEKGHHPECQKKWEHFTKCNKRREGDLKRETLFVKKHLRELGVKLPTGAK